MAEFVKDLNLGWQLASGVANVDQRSGSVHFDERMVTQGSGITLIDDGAQARFYACDGSYPMADVYPITVAAGGTLRVNSPYNHQTGRMWVMDANGVEILNHEPNKFSSRQYNETTAPVSAGTHYLHVELRGRRSCEYTMNIQVDGSTAGNADGSIFNLYGAADPNS